MKRTNVPAERKLVTNERNGFISLIRGWDIIKRKEYPGNCLNHKEIRWRPPEREPPSLEMTQNGLGFKLPERIIEIDREPFFKRLNPVGHHHLRITSIWFRKGIELNPDENTIPLHFNWDSHKILTFPCGEPSDGNPILIETTVMTGAMEVMFIRSPEHLAPEMGATGGKDVDTILKAYYHDLLTGRGRPDD